MDLQITRATTTIFLLILTFATLNQTAQSASATDERVPYIATDGNAICAAIWSNGNDLQTARSIDDGDTWTNAASIYTTTTRVDPTGVLHTGNQFIAHWNTHATIGMRTRYTSYIATSFDGVTWSQPAILGPVRIVDADTSDDGTAVFSTIVDAPYANPADVQDIIYQSSDHGQSWTSSTIPVIPSTGFSGSFVTSLGNNRWGHILTSRTNPPTTTYWYESTDNGVTWSAPRDISTSVPYINDLETHNGTTAVSHATGFRISTDNGLTWQDINSTNTSDNHQIVVDNAGNWLVTMFQGIIGFPTGFETIYNKRSTDPLTSWSDIEIAFRNQPQHIDRPQTIALGNGKFLTIFETRFPNPDRQDSDDPLYTDYDIQVIRTNNAGVTWSQPVYVNSNYTSIPQPASAKSWQNYN